MRKLLLLAIFALALTFEIPPAVAKPQSCEAKCAKLISTTRQAYKRQQCVHGCRMREQQRTMAYQLAEAVVP